MALPKIDSPTFMLVIPSTKETIRYRPFTVKEEKVLLVALQSNDDVHVESAIKQILNNCIIDDINVDELATYDIEYMFLQLRGKSVNNIIKLVIQDEEDNQSYDVEIDLDDIHVSIDEQRSNVIELNDQVTIIMKDPTYHALTKLQRLKDEGQMIVEAVALCIDKILLGDDEVLTMKDHTKKEQEEFIESFSAKNMREIEQFFNSIPKLTHTIHYTTTSGEKKQKEVSGLQSFFT